MFQRQLEAVPGLVEEMLEQGEGRIKALFMQQAEQVRQGEGEGRRATWGLERVSL